LPTKERIEARAYEIYLQRRGEDGNPLGDWLQAEQELGDQFDALSPNEAESLDASATSLQGSTERIAKSQTK
jgi:hypothetical protein